MLIQNDCDTVIAVDGHYINAGDSLEIPEGPNSTHRISAMLVGSVNVQNHEGRRVITCTGMLHGREVRNKDSNGNKAISITKRSSNL